MNNQNNEIFWWTLPEANKEAELGKARVLNHDHSNPKQVHTMIKHLASLSQTDATAMVTGVQNPAV